MQKTADIPITDAALAVAYRLLELCRDHELSLNDLARVSDVPLSTIKNILNGASRNPGITTINKICAGLGITLAEFFSAPIFAEKLAPVEE